ECDGGRTARRRSSRCADGIRATDSTKRGPSSRPPTTATFTCSPTSSTSRRSPRASSGGERHDENYTLMAEARHDSAELVLPQESIAHRVHERRPHRGAQDASTGALGNAVE